MTNAQHTPSPWSHELGETYGVRDAQGGRVALCTNLRGPHGLGGRRDAVEVAANARLIAAAPDLLAALVELLPCVGWSNETDEGLQYEANAGNETAPRIMSARAAIAKATGAQS